jgi:hypothetical protein
LSLQRGRLGIYSPIFARPGRNAQTEAIFGQKAVAIVSSRRSVRATRWQGVWRQQPQRCASGVTGRQPKNDDDGNWNSNEPKQHRAHLSFLPFAPAQPSLQKRNKIAPSSAPAPIERAQADNVVRARSCACRPGSRCAIPRRDQPRFVRIARRSSSHLEPDRRRRHRHRSKGPGIFSCKKTRIFSCNKESRSERMDLKRVDTSSPLCPLFLRLMIMISSHASSSGYPEQNPTRGWSSAVSLGNYSARFAVL